MKNISFLDKIDKQFRKIFDQPVMLPVDYEILNENDQCSHALFLLSGEIEVYKLSENGKTFRLYKIVAGEACVLNLSCILSKSSYVAYAKTLRDCEVVLIPKNEFMEMFNSEESIREYVFRLISTRLIEITAKVEGIVLKSLEERLRDFFLDNNQPIIYITHEQLANQLGSAREVISRQLKIWEREKKIKLYRGKIEIIKL